MDARENGDETPQPVPVGRGCYTCNLIFTVLIALSMSVITTLLLTILKHNEGFAVLSGLFTAILYCVLVFLRILRHRAQTVQRLRRQETGMYPVEEDSQEARFFYRGTVIGIVLYGLLGVSAFVGLYYLPDQHIIFALLSAVFALILLHCFFTVCWLVPMRLFAHKGHLSTDEERRKWYLTYDMCCIGSAPYGDKLGSSSHKNASPLKVVPMEKEVQASIVHHQRFGEGECFTNKASQALPERVIPALHMGCFTCFFSRCCVLLFRNDSLVGLPKISEAVACTIG
jgi:hypothetical protein